MLYTLRGGVQLFKNSLSPPAIVYFATAAGFLLPGFTSHTRQRRRERTRRQDL
ncbi:hypothetical protein ABLG96_15325 [Nakamurella sp. A5-74]|uniref:Uncharacterized protein n=1 Tax=Nakamurella sp. A5-74 TaxID=3158264 RepID=A0AAU8DML9_9ACTN